MTATKHLKVLELDKILAMCGDHAVSPEAKDRISQITPATSFEEAQHSIALTTDAHSLTNQYGNPGLYAILTCEEKVKKAKVGATLTMKELLEVASVLKGARTLLKWREQSKDEFSLDSLFDGLLPNRTLETDIYDSILSEDEMSDNASKELSDIRRKITSANSRARENLERIVRSPQHEKYLQEQIITIRNGRFVVPVRSEYRNEIKGLVHDTSATGSTLFIEPMAVVELNNQIKELEAAQQNEINRILLAFSGHVADFGDSLLSNYDILIDLDTIFAKCRLADQMRADMPVLVRQGETKLIKARHPLISKDNVVPIDLYLGGDFDTLVITGPNTGGKTVAIKTLGLLTLMTLCGFMIPCGSGSTVCFYEKVLADIGDEQSIEQSLSTFSSHMTNIVSILEQADSSTLVLIDELGAGTDPVEGAALAVAIINQLRKQGAKIAATTHYSEIKMYALETEGVENASCEFDVATLQPTYRLLIGTLGKSNAFAISQRLGLSPDIVAVAEKQISTENKRFEDVVASLEETRQELEDERSTVENLHDQAKMIKQATEKQRRAMEEEMKAELVKARDQAQSVVAQVRFQYDELMKDLDTLRKEQKSGTYTSSMAQARGDLRKKLNELEDTATPKIPLSKEQYKLPRALKRGDVVFLTNFNSEGTVLSAPDNKGNIRVKAGILETKVPLDNVRLVKDAEKVTFNSGAVTTRKRGIDAQSRGSGELDLRGFDSSEAIMELQRFIDSAVLSNMAFISIIHGKGTGVLRKTVQEYLRSHPSVRTHRLGVHGEGDSGVTIAELK